MPPLEEGVTQRCVTLIDAHHHLWDLQSHHYPWLQDQPEPHFFMGNYDALKRNYLPHDYRRDSAQHRVLATVHCEAEWTRDDQVGETDWITRMHQEHGMPAVIVAHAWFHTDNAADVLARQAANPLVRGIRSKPVTASSPDRMQSGLPGSMQDPRWLKGYARLAEYGLSWDLRVPYWHLSEAAEVIRAHPDIPVVLNHTGFPWDRSPQGLMAWEAAMRILAREEHVWLKVSEFGLRDQPWRYEDNRRIVRTALDLFGIERCMFASNFPVSSLRVDYNRLVCSMAEMVSDYTPAQQRGFFVENAAQFYRIDPALWRNVP